MTKKLPTFLASKDKAFYSKKTLNINGNLVALTAPKIMGILNVTPDSFSDGGKYLDPPAAAEQAMELSRRNSESLYHAAFVALAVGREEAALDFIQEAVGKNPAYRDFFRIDPGFDRLTGHPRFEALMRDPQSGTM